MEQIFILLLALILGYGLGVFNFNEKILEKPLEYLVMAVIIVMGNSSSSTILNSQKFLSTVPVFCLFILLFNLIGLRILFTFIYPSFKSSQESKNGLNINPKMLISSMKYMLALFMGLASSLLIGLDPTECAMVVDAMIFAMLFIVGIQLRRQRLDLSTIFLNKTGIIIGLSAMLLTLAAGVAAAKVLHIPSLHGFLVVSGYGWYTLSGLMVTDILGSELGTTAFLVDFFREILAILLIPLLRNLGPSLAVGYSGATALDFCLPVIKFHHGKDAVPIAITSGLLLTLLAPLTMILCRSFNL